MSGLSHVRFALFDRERYTEAQAAELRQLRALYTTHLVPVFGPSLPDAFALRTEENAYYPRYTANTLTSPPITPVPPANAMATQPYKSFADTFITTLESYEASRRHRWFGKGHPNDPTRLLGIFLRNLFDGWLRYAPSNATTLQQVMALRQYLEVLDREDVFTRESEGHDSLAMLVHNLATPLTFLEDRLRHEISLQSAREHFSELKEGITNVLSEAAHYLFYALAEKNRTQLPFSLVNMQASVVNKPLKKALETREGFLLKQWIHSPGVTRSLLPQTDAEGAKSVLIRKPTRLLATEVSTPLLDEKGHAHRLWCEFLEQTPSEAEFDPAAKKLSLGICPVLLESKGLPEGESTLLADAIQLHGLLEELAAYQAYLHECWQLAGFGGDHCMYDQIAEAVVSILTELRGFTQVLRVRLGRFQERLAVGNKAALDATKHLEWRTNYKHAKAHQERLLGMLTGCDAVLIRVIAHAQDTAARSERRTLAAKAYQVLQSAPTFLNQARQHVGLTPKAHYPGLETPDSKAAPTLFCLTPTAEQVTISHLLVMLLPQSPQEVADLSKLCAETPSAPPWSGFRGTYQRYRYLHNNTRLKKIGQDLASLQLNALTPMTEEKKVFIGQLRAQLQAEQARITELSGNLWWPFHRASIQFFATLQRGIAEKLRDLTEMSVSAITEATPQDSSVEVIEQLLCKGEATLLEAKRSTERAEKKRMKANLRKPLSAESRERLVRMHQQYSHLTATQRADFERWQQNRFGRLIWNEQGVVQSGLTEADGSAILDRLAEFTIQRADAAVAISQLIQRQVAECLRSRGAFTAEALPRSQPSLFNDKNRK